MLSITDGGSLARALAAPLDARLKRLLIQRRDQLGGDLAGEAHFVVVQPGDTPAAIEQALGFDPLQNPVDRSRFGDPGFTPATEWLTDHGFCFEAVFILDDSGFAHVLFVPNEEGIEPELLALCRAYADEHA